MKIIGNKILLLIVCILSTGGMLAQTNFTLPEYTKTVLPNGLTVYLMEQHEVPMIQFSVVVESGAVHDSKSGVAQSTAEGLLLGTKKFDKSTIEDKVDFIGASLSSSAGLERSYIWSSFMKKDQDVMLPVLQDVLLNPIFPEEEWTKLQSRKVAELTQSKESPRAVISNYYNAFVYQNHVYGNAVDGDQESVAAITVSDLKQFYTNNYIPNNTAIAVVGDFSTKEMSAKISSLFKRWEKGELNDIAITKKAEANKPRVLLVNKEDAGETTFLIGGKGVPRNNKDLVGINVINTVLGGRFTSWLNDELRVNSGLTYGARSGFSTYKHDGVFQISTFTANATTEETIDLALKTYQRLHTNYIDEATLASAKNYTKGQFPPNFETNSSLGSLLLDMHVYDFNESYINTFSQTVDELTVDKVKVLVDSYFPKDNLQFVLVGKAEELKKFASKYGEVTTKEITDTGY